MLVIELLKFSNTFRSWRNLQWFLELMWMISLDHSSFLNTLIQAHLLTFPISLIQSSSTCIISREDIEGKTPNESNIKFQEAILWHHNSSNLLKSKSLVDDLHNSMLTLHEDVPIITKLRKQNQLEENELNVQFFSQKNSKVFSRLSLSKD
jgi:hypothetical protein